MFRIKLSLKIRKIVVTNSNYRLQVTSIWFKVGKVQTILYNLTSSTILYDFYSPSSIHWKNIIFFIIENGKFAVTKFVISHDPFHVSVIWLKCNRFKRLSIIWNRVHLYTLRLIPSEFYPLQKKNHYSAIFTSISRACLN